MMSQLMPGCRFYSLYFLKNIDLGTAVKSFFKRYKQSAVDEKHATTMNIQCKNTLLFKYFNHFKHAFIFFLEHFKMAL